MMLLIIFISIYYFVNIARDLMKNSYPENLYEDDKKSYNSSCDESNCLTSLTTSRADVSFFIPKFRNSKTNYFAPKILKLASYTLSEILSKLFNKCVLEGFFRVN
jgi:hypothetical protein